MQTDITAVTTHEGLRICWEMRVMLYFARTEVVDHVAQLYTSSRNHMDACSLRREDKHEHRIIVYRVALFVCLNVVYRPNQQLWSCPDGQLTYPHFSWAATEPSCIR